MDNTISSADANRRFSVLLRGVRKGQSYLITSHGQPVARIVPAREPTSVQRGARQALLDRLARQRHVDVERWTRDELYEDER